MLHDTILYEGVGMPAVALVTDTFMVQSAYQAKMLGLDDAQVTWVEHPISDNTQEVIHKKAEKALQSVVEQLTVASTRPLHAISPAQARL
mmetsp:Transcript_54209/g.97305  ORF Transcript_54209/g.97305 Transcript_54209/m.97305 type:complete len:90 (-) Transcript_54209:18-287(-)